MTVKQGPLDAGKRVQFLDTEFGRSYNRRPFVKSSSTKTREDSTLSEVRLGRDENFESLLKRFNKKVQQNGILSEARRREYYEKPSIKRKKKAAAAARKRRNARR